MKSVRKYRLWYFFSNIMEERFLLGISVLSSFSQEENVVLLQSREHSLLRYFCLQMYYFLLFKGQVTKAIINEQEIEFQMINQNAAYESNFICRFISQAPLLNLIYPDLISKKSFTNIVDLAGIYSNVCLFLNELNIWKMN